MSDPRRRFFLDTAVLALAVGDAHPARSSCRQFLEAAAAGQAELHVSVEALQELMFHRMRRTSREDAVRLVRQLHRACVVHPFDDAVTLRMLEVVTNSSLGGRDAVHAATALQAGFTEIVSPDRDFNNVPGLARLDPTAVW